MFTTTPAPEYKASLWQLPIFPPPLPTFCQLNSVADPGLKLTLTAFLPPVIFYFLPKIRGALP